MFSFAAALVAQQPPAPLRPPAVPLVTHDPYFSIWSMADRLNGAGTSHWTGKPNTLSAAVRIDGKTFRLMGRDRAPSPALEQIGPAVLPTRTIYQFAGGGVSVALTFFTPALPEDLEVLSRPLTYIEWAASSMDGKEHQAAIYFDAASELVVNTADQPVWTARYQLDGEPLLRMGSRDQPILMKRGDDLRIDWGYLYLAPDRREGASGFIGSHRQSEAAFDDTGRTPDSDDFSDRSGRAERPGSLLAFRIELGHIGSLPVSRYLMAGVR